jgi:hypothetical protein
MRARLQLIDQTTLQPEGFIGATGREPTAGVGLDVPGGQAPGRGDLHGSAPAMLQLAAAISQAVDQAEVAARAKAATR